MRVLLIEDSPMQVEILTGLLRDGGHSVVASSSMSGALFLLGAGDFNAIILDLGLPDGEGVESVEAVSEVAPGTALVVYTAESDEDVILGCLNAGADNVIHKGAQATIIHRALLVASAHRAKLRRRGAASVLATEAAIASVLGLSYVATG